MTVDLKPQTDEQLLTFLADLEKSRDNIQSEIDLVKEELTTRSVEIHENE